MKAVIEKIGTVSENGVARGWKFNCCGNPAIKLTERDGSLIAGYTIEELREISRKEKEEKANAS